MFSTQSKQGGGTVFKDGQGNEVQSQGDIKSPQGGGGRGSGTRRKKPGSGSPKSAGSPKGFWLF